MDKKNPKTLKKHMKVYLPSAIQNGCSKYFDGYDQSDYIKY